MSNTVKKIRGAKLIRELSGLLDDPERQKDVHIKLGDFGFATQLGEDEMIKFYCGTPLNMAPEILNDKFYNHTVDVWSVGVAIYEALFRVPPFTGKDQTELLENINNGFVQIPSHI